MQRRVTSPERPTRRSKPSKLPFAALRASRSRQRPHNRPQKREQAAALQSASRAGLKPQEIFEGPFTARPRSCPDTKSPFKHRSGRSTAGRDLRRARNHESWRPCNHVGPADLHIEIAAVHAIRPAPPRRVQGRDGKGYRSNVRPETANEHHAFQRTEAACRALGEAIQRSADTAPAACLRPAVSV